MPSDETTDASSGSTEGSPRRTWCNCSKNVFKTTLIFLIVIIVFFGVKSYMGAAEPNIEDVGFNSHPVRLRNLVKLSKFKSIR